jgi:hypothetical protein
MPKTPWRSNGPQSSLSRHRLSRAALAFALCVLALLTPRSADSRTAEAKFFRAGTIGEVVATWRPEMHLFVLGDVGLKENALRELAGWLADKHWTVLLVQDASGQTFQDDDGVVHEGVDALEYGTGQGIPRRPGFPAQVEPRTQEPDGAILTIVLAQRALFYTGAEARDRRGLGEAQFRDNLDRWAVAAMRSGAGAVSAVKDTVTHVDDALDAAIQGEFQAAEQTRAQAKAEVAAASAALAGLEEKAAALLAAHPAMTGALAHPDVEGLRNQIAAAGLKAAEDPGTTFQAVAEIQGQIQAQVQAIEAYPASGKTLAAARDRLVELERREGAAVVREELARAHRWLAEARELYDRGAPGYVEPLSRLQGELSNAGVAISFAEASAARRHGAVVALVMLLATGLLVGGFALNRRRRGDKREAERLLAAWRAALDRKLAALLDELEQRVARFVGPASGEGKRPWTGETLRLAGQIRADTGSLSILWTSAGSVLEKAEALIRAHGLAAVYNFFFPGRYRKGIRLLKDEPVPFDPAGGLPKLFGAERTWRDDLLGDLASYEPFRKSFQEIVDELVLRAARAMEALDIVEHAMLQGPELLEEIAARIAHTASLQEEIERAGAGDGLFRVPAVFAAALPAAQAALGRARALFPTDPVAALRVDGALARRTAVEAAQLAGLAAGARHGVLPAVESGAAALREAAIATRWIEEERRRLSGDADLLATRAAEAEVAPGIEELAQRLAGLGARADRAVELSKVLGETARPEIARVIVVIATARGELGAALGLPPERMLRETGADPSERLGGAARQSDRAQEMLGGGDLASAEAALAEAARLTAEAAAIVAATRQAFADQEATVVERRAETARVEGMLPDHERILAGIRETFAASVLSLRADDPGHPEANATLADNLDEARVHVGLAHEKLDRAIAAFRSGLLLAAAGLLREVKRHQELAVHRLDEVAEREARLARTVVSNRELLATLEGRVREDRIAVAGDPRTMQPTVAAFEDGERRVAQARILVEAAAGDPLAAEDELLAAQAVLREVHDRMAPGDRLRFAEAQKSVEAAARQLAAAGALAQRAAGDRIPDSPEIERGRAAIGSLASAQAGAEEALKAAHGDWDALDAEADRITAEAARWAATLQGEIAAGESAAKALSDASGMVREAVCWSGSYGVMVSGNPGSVSLARARSLLEQGRYAAAEEEARSARQDAADAIQTAEETVRRLRAEERRREEEEEESRRRSEAARSFAFSSNDSSSSSSSSGSDSSSSSSSSSSGSGSSSWESSGSGAGKSGW